MKPRPQNYRPYPGTRPYPPVTSTQGPDCYLCTWVVRQAVWSVPEGQGKALTWELKYINAMCSQHVRLAAA